MTSQERIKREYGRWFNGAKQRRGRVAPPPERCAHMKRIISREVRNGMRDRDDFDLLCEEEDYDKHEDEDSSCLERADVDDDEADEDEQPPPAPAEQPTPAKPKGKRIPYGRAPDPVLEAPYTDAEVRLYAFMTRHADAEGLVHLDAAATADKFGWGSTKFTDTMNALKQRGAVRVHTRARAGNTTRYQLLLEFQ
jgi:hypothetical protein